MQRLSLRVYTSRTGASSNHSFCVAADGGGLTATIDTVVFADTTTFTQLRRDIECVSDRGMFRRTPMFQEVLDVMQRAPNPHGYSHSEKLTCVKYRFGRLRGCEVTGEVDGPRMIPQANEVPVLVAVEDEGLCVSEVFTDVTERDLVLVPQSQIDRSGALSSDAAPADAAPAVDAAAGDGMPHTASAAAERAQALEDGVVFGGGDLPTEIRASTDGGVR